MNISNVQVKLKGSDILSIINDFVKVEGLDLKSVNINNGIEVEGSFKKGIKINFKGTISDLSVIDEKLHLRFSALKVWKVGIFRIFRSLGIKFLLRFLGDLGIDGNKDKLIIDIDKILQDVKIVKLKLKEVEIIEDVVCAEVYDIKINLSGNNEEEISEDTEENKGDSKTEENKEDSEAKEENSDGTIEEDVEDEEIDNLIIEKKTDDYYNKGRNIAKEKLEETLPKTKEFSDYLFVIPDLIALTGRLLRDERVPVKTKLTISGSIAYLLFPNDLIPNKIPFVGQIDDLAVLFFALNRIANDVPAKVLLENWSGKNELIVVLKNGLEYVINFTGAKNLEKIVRVIEELGTL
ncbi:MAG: YkvA family protein [Clostridium sp.]